MSPPIVIYTSKDLGAWYYDDEEGTFGPFDTAQDLFLELKRLGKVSDGSCPTCQDE